MNRLISLITIISFALVFTSMGFSQTPTANDIPNVYVDCRWCDYDYIRTEIAYVNYVRERQEADIHILITQQRTGGDGIEFTLTFIGKENFTGVNDTLIFVSNETDSDDIIRQEMVRVIKLGLIPYLSKTSIAKNLSISFIQPKEEISQVVQDKWNNWVFSIRLRSFLNGQESTNSVSIWGSLSAKRVTEDWKLEVSTGGSYNEDNFDFAGMTYTSISRSQRFNTSAIKSISDYWSIGIWANMFSSTYSNIDYGISIVPGIEYNYYPYSESTRRQLRFGYTVGPEYRDYTEKTIYFKLNERIFEESISITLDLIQTWGSIRTTISGSHFFHDFEKNRVQLYGYLSLKIIKGLSLDINGRISMIHNQISLPSGGATLEEVLLRRKELATQYNYWGSIGLSYTFGSIYSHIVNPRFGNW